MGITRIGGRGSLSWFRPGIVAEESLQVNMRVKPPLEHGLYPLLQLTLEKGDTGVVELTTARCAGGTCARRRDPIGAASNRANEGCRGLPDRSTSRRARRAVYAARLILLGADRFHIANSPSTDPSKSPPRLASRRWTMETIRPALPAADRLDTDAAHARRNACPGCRGEAPSAWRCRPRPRRTTSSASPAPPIC